MPTTPPGTARSALVHLAPRRPPRALTAAPAPCTPPTPPTPPGPPAACATPNITALLTLLTALFALRVAVQAIQYWTPLPFLPPHDWFQGSRLPYGLLLVAQLLILAVMVRAIVQIVQGRRYRSPGQVRFLTGAAVLYLLAALGRAAIGLFWPDAHPWFRSPVSVVFHLVLAAFVALLAGHDRRQLGGRAGTTPPLPDVLTWPLLMGGALLAFTIGLARDLPLALATFAPIVVAAVTIAALEVVRPERAEWRPDRAALRVDLAFLAGVQVLLPRLLTALTVLALAQWREQLAPLPVWPHAWPLAAQIVLLVVLVDLLRYALHRAAHRPGWLWRLHAVHHAPERLYALNVTRFHPLEKSLQWGLDTLPFLILGVAPAALAGYFVIYAVNGFLQHANLRQAHGWLNRLFVTAAAHRWHHARDARLGDCNFGNITMLWDTLFGTRFVPTGRSVGELGIAAAPQPRPADAGEQGEPSERGAHAAPGDGSVRSRPGAHRAINALIRLTLRWRAWRTRRQLETLARDPMAAQRAVLRRILRANRATAFGRQHGFDRLARQADLSAAYAAAVPMADFEALRPWIDAQFAGSTALTASAPCHALRTSGTTGLPKDVPLTPAHRTALRRIHHQAVALQHQACPEAFGGAILAIVSPATEGRLASGLPYGSASGVVAGCTPALLRERFVLPAAVAEIGDADLRALLILRLALARPDITWMGTANPGTLLALLELYRERRAALLDDLRNGGFHGAAGLPEGVRAAVASRLGACPERAAELERLASRGQPETLATLWPELRMVVTWTCASAGIPATTLRASLAARTRIFELGYLASEFRGTISLDGHPDHGLPTLDSHYFEFIEPADHAAGRASFLTLDQLETGRDYLIVVTTPSGLYRYFINDLVRVTGRWQATPLLRFAQKGKGVTSIAGEKLTESQVLEAVGQVLREHRSVTPFFVMLADAQRAQYTLYLEAAPGNAADALPDPLALAACLDRQLAALNLEWEAKRTSRRLPPPRVVCLRAGSAARCKAAAMARGQRAAQYKCPALAWRHEFPCDPADFPVPLPAVLPGPGRSGGDCASAPTQGLAWSGPGALEAA